MNYKRGDIVHIKSFEHEKYIFLGGIRQEDPLLIDNELEEDVREIMGKDADLGMYIELPVRVRIDGRSEYTADIVFGDIEKFELVDNAKNADTDI